MATTSTESNPFSSALKVLPWLLGLAAVVAGIFLLVWGLENYSRGAYAGQGYSDAKTEAIDVMQTKYGLTFATHMRLGVPDVLNTHMKSNILIGNSQVRVFQLIGPRGVHYCVPLWESGSIKQEATQVVKGCKFTSVTR